MKRIRLLPVFVAIGVLGTAAAFLGASPDRPGRPESAGANGSQNPIATDGYTCPMHPQVHSAEPGDCPKCGMSLVRASDAAAADGCVDHTSGCCPSVPAERTLPAGHPPVPGYTVETTQECPAHN